MMERTKLVSHGVVHAEERICECHTCHAGSIVHLFTCLRIVRAVLVCGRKVVEYKLNSLHCKSVCVVGCHDGYICLDRMCHNVDTGRACQSFRSCHSIVNVNDCHVRKQSVVSDRPFNACLSVCDDRERSYLRTCT